MIDGYVYEWVDDESMYRTVPKEQANPAKIIKCNCGEPATILEFGFAWSSSGCWCDKCYQEKDKK